jgi:hypothetical protein
MRINDVYVRIRVCIQKFRGGVQPGALEKMTHDISLGDRHFVLHATIDLQLASMLLSS